MKTGKCHNPLYRTWREMHYRCYHPKSKDFKWYGGRGIQVCDRWFIFENFASDMGPKPNREDSIDRINNDEDYSPSNCRWVASIHQNNNRRDNLVIGIDGTQKTVAQWSRETGINVHTIYTRLRRGWAERSAIFNPLLRQRKPTQAWDEKDEHNRDLEYESKQDYERDGDTGSEQGE